MSSDPFVNLQGMDRDAWGYTLWNRYDITVADYETLLNAQDGKCAICGLLQDQNKKHFDIDHDHVSGAIRGLLCGRCNKRLSTLEDENFVHLALDYLERPIAVQVGVVRRLHERKPGWFTTDGNGRSAEYRAAISARMKGRVFTEDTIERMRIAAQKRGGRPHTPESRAKISLANSKRVWTDESRAKLSATRLAKFGKRGGDAQ
jgi:hypothetical protein